LTRLTLLVLTALLGAGPAAAKDFVLVCYLRQYGAGPIVDFVRRLEFRDGTGAVGIADNLGTGFRYIGKGRLLRSDKTVIRFDFASPLTAGVTTIDRRTGEFHYAGDGWNAITGTCSAEPSI